MICWGVVTAITAATYNYHALLAARILLGIFEAAIAPCLMLISAMYYTKSEQAPRFSFWYCGLGLGQILGGIISYGFQKVRNPTFAGWRIMFITLGIVTVIVGIVTILFLPDTPMKARFLTEKEKVALLRHVSVNQTGISNTHFKFSHLREVLFDLQLWLMTILTILVSHQSVARDFKMIFLLISGLDFGVKRCGHQLFSNANQELWFLITQFGVIEHALRNCQHRIHLDCRTRHSKDFTQVGLAGCLLHSGYSGRRSAIFPTAQQGRSPGRHLPGELDCSNSRRHLPVDHRQLRRADQTSRGQRSHCWFLLGG